ncbi:YggT family protein [Laspinema olomoucense]|uniref:YggT family protein n=1 Tax=Laspinema olomoucense D3b TaxID=2953688 RepID=A0ABT2N6M3_9CYAN|nr:MULTISPECIES: YggT family protein [unclassified Laspinema]MCT7972351.1 YggT family protein [Laspinema sp. D3d]MCT7977474.1 YggT family protein [Laspinema sp. D3b]MCT7986887.1 YggT family protein [Laspinema sp. D3a]MCT7995309.1 YggT family protein [Laspinema sp. D3c]
MNPDYNRPDRENATQPPSGLADEEYPTRIPEQPLTPPNPGIPRGDRAYSPSEQSRNPAIDELRREQERHLQNLGELRQEEARLSRQLQDLRQQEEYINRRIEGIQLEEEERRIADIRHRLALSKTNQVIYYLMGALGVLLVLRVVLRLLGANPDNQFAGFIYALSSPFVTPFETLFITPTFGNSAFEINALIAIAIYGLLTWLVIRLLQLIWT